MTVSPLVCHRSTRVRLHFNCAWPVLGDPARRPEAYRVATPPGRDDAVDEDVGPVDRVVVPREVVGVHERAVKELR